MAAAAAAEAMAVATSPPAGAGGSSSRWRGRIRVRRRRSAAAVARGARMEISSCTRGGRSAGSKGRRIKAPPPGLLAGWRTWIDRHRLRRRAAAGEEQESLHLLRRGRSGEGDLRFWRGSPTRGRTPARRWAARIAEHLSPRCGGRDPLAPRYGSDPPGFEPHRGFFFFNLSFCFPLMNWIFLQTLCNACGIRYAKAKRRRTHLEELLQKLRETVLTPAPHSGEEDVEAALILMAFSSEHLLNASQKR